MKTVLRRFREIVMEFIENATQFGILFDNKTINHNEDKGKFVTKKQQTKPILSEENLLVAKE
ncbi:MAG: hypothetical protein ACFFB0_17555 [Promethearchaeota archaeon]